MLSWLSLVHSVCPELKVYALHPQTFRGFVYCTLLAWTTQRVHLQAYLCAKHQTLVSVIGGRRQQVACVWSCHSQWWYKGRVELSNV